MSVMEQLRRQRVVGIVRTSTAEAALVAARGLVTSGLRCVEVSLVTPGAIDVIAQLNAEPGLPGDAFVGAGTVLTAREVADVRSAGAEFVVAPNLEPDVVRACGSAEIPVIPGVLTPSEALRAMSLGAAAVKLFPASLWTPSAMADVLAALPALEFVPTGGIELHQAPEWVKAGAMAVGMGSALTRGGPEVAQQTCRELLDALRAAR